MEQIMNEYKITVDSLEMTQLEKDLYRLAMITGRFYYVYNMLPKIPDNSSTNYSFKSSLREYAIIQLHNFLDIHDSLRSDLKNINKEIIDMCLKPFWEPIHNQRQAIKQLRNEYLAHLQEIKKTQFNKTIEEILHDSRFAGSWNDITYYAGCVLNYSQFMESNFQTEWYSAEAKYRLSIIANRIEVMFARGDIQHIQDVDSELNKSINSVVESLKNNNLKHEPVSIDKFSFSYKEKINDSPNTKPTMST